MTLSEMYSDVVEHSQGLKEVGILGLSYVLLKNILPGKDITIRDCFWIAPKIRNFLQRYKNEEVDHLVFLAKYRGKYYKKGR